MQFLEQVLLYILPHENYPVAITRVTHSFLLYSVIVSILSIAGTDCRLVELGKVANKTAGKVSRVPIAVSVNHKPGPYRYMVK